MTGYENSSFSSSSSFTGGDETSTECVLPPANATIPTALEPVYATLEIACAVLSVVGNSVIILLFVKKRSLRTVKNCYVISLASADLLVALVGIPSAVTVSVGLPRHFHACLLMTSVLMLLCTASILSLVAVTVDRFWSIMRPLTYPVTMTHSRARAAIFVCWCLSTVIGLLPLFGWNRGRPPAQERCFFVEVTDPNYLIFIFFGTIVVPTIFMAVLYFAIFYEVRRQSKKLSPLVVARQRQQPPPPLEAGSLTPSSSSPPGVPQERRLSLWDAVSLRGGSASDLSPSDRQLKQQLKTSTKTVKSILIVVVVFLVSWYPLYVLNTVVYFRRRQTGGGADDSGCIPSSAFAVTIVLSHFNSVWNPIIYGWKMKDFRLAIKKLFCGPTAKLDSSATL